MITKKVNRYYCEFCKKAGQSAMHISGHEKSCTMNPNRVCNMCKMTPGPKPQKPMTELFPLMPKVDPGFWNTWGSFDGSLLLEMKAVVDAITKALPALRDACGDCPACILATLRQSGIRVPLITSFNFTKEVQFLWDCINENKEESRYASAYSYA